MNVRFVDSNNIAVDPELEKLLPPLSEDDYDSLEQSLLENGFMRQSSRIQLWCPPEEELNEDNEHPAKSYIIDGHNRFRICQKHGIDLPQWCFEWLIFDTKDEVKKYMFENQLARRNLSEVARYEVVEKYSNLLENMAKKNQSAGGKGLSNLTKVNVRKEKAKQVGISEGSYHKLDKVMKSDNEEIKDKLRKKEISIDKAYQEVKSPKVQNNIESTPQQRIEKIDNRMNDIDKEISSLRIEREALMRKRSIIFETLDIECELKYEFVEKSGVLGVSRNCRFYIEFDGHKKIFVECGVFIDAEPDNFYLDKIPEKYKNDFVMLWKKAHEEDVKDFNERTAKWSKQFEKENKNVSANDDNKDFYKKCFRILAKSFHPDNSDGSIEDMQNLNQLKMLWGI